MTDIQKLKELAQSATPGPWECREADGSAAICHAHGWVAGDFSEQTLTDTRYMAAANPAAVLELIAELERFDDGMRSLAFQLGAGGYNAVTLSAGQLVDKVSGGLEAFTSATAQLLDTVAAEREQLKAVNFDLYAGQQAMVEEVKALRGLLAQCALSATTLRADDGILAEHSGFSESFVDILRKHSAVEAGHGAGSPMYPSQRDAVAQAVRA
jgi:hypothetical protein